jgi:hypothetical protein
MPFVQTRLMPPSAPRSCKERIAKDTVADTIGDPSYDGYLYRLSGPIARVANTFLPPEIFPST